MTDGAASGLALGSRLSNFLLLLLAHALAAEVVGVSSAVEVDADAAGLQFLARGCLHFGLCFERVCFWPLGGFQVFG